MPAWSSFLCLPVLLPALLLPALLSRPLPSTSIFLYPTRIVVLKQPAKPIHHTRTHSLRHSTMGLVCLLGDVANKYRLQ